MDFVEFLYQRSMTKPRPRSLKGLWADLHVDITEEDIAEARRELGGTFPPLDLAIAQRIRHIPRDVLPDMPDQIIVATALHLNLHLVTRYQRIQTLGIKTIW